MGKFTLQQQVALAIAPKISTALSIVGSGWISVEVLRDKRKIGKVYHRLMLVMSLGDVFRSAAQFLTTWPMPAGTSGVVWSAGNTATCSAQGFVFQAGLPFILYNAYLAIYYVMVLKWNWPDWRIKRFEPAALAFTVCLSAVTSVAGLPLRLYNAANLWCWIAPLNCEESGNRDCERGENSWIYRYAFWYVWLWSTIAINTIGMLMIFFAVHVQERRMSRTYSEESGVGRKMRECRKLVGSQAIFFTVTFFLQTSFNTATRVIQQKTGEVYFPLVSLMAFFAPLNGFWHGLIYLRPRFLSLKKKNPDWSLRQVIREVLSRIKKGSNDDSDNDHELGVYSNSNSSPGSDQNDQQLSVSPDQNDTPTSEENGQQLSILSRLQHEEEP